MVKLFLWFLENTGAYGERKFARDKNTSIHDVLLLQVLSSLAIMERGYLVGVFCSDVSGAFNRVCAEKTTKKLTIMHLHLNIHGLLVSSLEPRVENGRREEIHARYAAL